ncbi:MAG TPA: glycosyltransferase family 39 protein [Candidatus Hydrogenedentes bacterium]|nr:glycosyltransferase family 39 protein [Candidatus Hydrogenedentota bacterium]
MEQTSRRYTGLILAIILLGGLALRLYGIRAESVWWDEYTSLKYLDAPSLPAFLRINHTLDPATMPVYDAFEYLWGRFISPLPIGLRLASVAFGIATIAVMYAIGSLAFGPVAGLLAAALVALSPIHRHFSQEIHMYGLVALLASASLYTLLRILRGGQWPWWAAHVLLNILLMWSHTFGLLAPFAEGVYLLLAHRQPINRLFVWCGLHAIMVAPLLLYVAGIQFWSPEQTASWQKTPGFLEFLGDVFADDAIHLTYQMRPSAQMRAWARLHPLFDLAWLAIAGAALAWGARRMPRDRTTLLFILFLLLPPIILYAASLAWRPCIFPRYTVYSSLGLYVLIGGAIAALPRNWMRTTGTIACAALMACQTAMLFPGPQRTDWLSAGRFLKHEAKPGEPILVQVSIWKDVLLFNMGGCANPVSSAETIETLVDQAAFLLNSYGCGDASRPCERTVWMVVVLDYFDSGPHKQLDALLAARNLRYRVKEFQGIEHVLAYAITATGKPVVDGKSPPDPKDFMEGYGNLAVALAEHGDRDTARQALHRIPGIGSAGSPTRDIYGNLLRAIESGNEISGPAAAIRALLDGYGYRQNNQLRAAAESFEKATRHDPGYAIAYSEWGMALADAHDFDTAVAPLRRAGELNPDLGIRYGRLAQVLAEKGDPAPTRKAMDLFLSGLGQLGSGRNDEARKTFEECARLDPQYALSHLCLAIVDLIENKIPECRAHLEKAFAADPVFLGAWRPFMVALFDTKDYNAAWHELHRIEAAGGSVSTPFVERLRAESGRDR